MYIDTLAKWPTIELIKEYQRQCAMNGGWVYMCLESSTTWCSNDVYSKSLCKERDQLSQRKREKRRVWSIELNGNETSGEQFTMQNQFTVSNNWWARGMHKYQSVIATFHYVVGRPFFSLLQPTSTSNGNEKLSFALPQTKNKNRYVFSVLFSLFILINVVVFLSSAYATVHMHLWCDRYISKEKHTQTPCAQLSSWTRNEF